MLSAEERKKNLEILDSNRDKEKLIQYENEFNINSVEAYYQNKKDDKSQEFRKIFLRYLYVNNNPFVINTKKEIVYVTIPRLALLKNVVSYLDEVRLLIDYNPNIVLVLTNAVSEYKKIINIANEKGILVMLLSDDSEDKYLDNSNLYVQISKNPKKDALKLNLKIINSNPFLVS